MTTKGGKIAIKVHCNDLLIKDYFFVFLFYLMPFGMARRLGRCKATAPSLGLIVACCLLFLSKRSGFLSLAVAARAISSDFYLYFLLILFLFVEPSTCIL
jgi:hypothetical protein